MSEPVDFALKPGAHRGDSAFLLNRGAIASPSIRFPAAS